MSAAYQISCFEEQQLFSEVDAMVASLKEKVRSKPWRDMTHSQVEREVHLEGMKLLRTFLQVHYDLRGKAKPVELVIGSEGAERTRTREGTQRKVETVFGTVVATRTGYGGRDVETLHPTDADLNLPAQRYSLEVSRQAALTAASASFDTAKTTIERMTAAQVPKRQLEEMIVAAACDFEDFYLARMLMPQPVAPSDLLVLSLDQKGVVVLNRDLRDATRLAAEASYHKLSSRLARGEKKNRKRMASVAAVYGIAPYQRTPEQIIDGLQHVREVDASPRPRPEGKRVWARLDVSLEQVISDAFDDGERRDSSHLKTWLVLVDGDPNIERMVRREARRRGIKILVVLDFIHALEYVWEASTAFFSEDDARRETWVLERLQGILEGRVSNVAAGMRRSASLRGLTAQQRRPVDRCAKYLLKRTRMMRYGELLAMGAPIATGVIEGACRHLICDRLDITGARWTVERAEAVLRLRAIIASGDFDEYWEYHEAAEWWRNHAARYAREQPPKVGPVNPVSHLRLVVQ